jgi:hypothetical protein
MNFPGTATRPIFRPEALQRFLDGREQPVLPRYAAGSVAALMWALVVLFMIGIAVIALAPIATYARGTGVVSGDGARVVVFVPAASLPRLARGQDVRLSLDINHVVAATVDTVEPAPISPGDARRRYGLDGAALLAITVPSAVVTVRLPHSVDARLFRGSVIPATVQTGSESIAARLSLSRRQGA